MMTPIGRSIPLLCAAVILGACSQSPQRAWDGIGAVLSGDMQQQVQGDHQRLAKALDRIDASDVDRAQLRQDFERIRGRLNDLDDVRKRLADLDELRGRLSELNRQAETVADLRRRLDAIQAHRQDPSAPADPLFKELRKEIGTVTNAPPPPIR